MSHDVSLWMIVGLGNPEPDYAGQRHNVGARMVRYLATSWGFDAFRQKKQALWTQGLLPHNREIRVMLWLPTTYMNLSGLALVTPSRAFPKANWLILHDELDLPLGAIRVKKGGGHAGHNGLKSIFPVLTQDFWRLRVGIGRPTGAMAVSDYVLSSFYKVQEPMVADMEARAQNIVEHLMVGKTYDEWLKPKTT